jgi:NADH-quinone oxidoreductase subunit L
LAALSLVAGWFVLPTGAVLPASPTGHPPMWTLVVAIGLPFLGIGIAYQVYVRNKWQALRFAQWQRLRQFLFQGWGFDSLYRRLLLTPFTALAQFNRNDVIDGLPKLLIHLSVFLHRLFSQLQNGQLRFYIATLATAAIIVLALALAIEVLQVNKAMGE